MLESMLVDVFTRFHSLCILGEISVQDNLAIPPDRSSKVFPLPSFLLHLFHNQVNFLCNSLAARAGVEFYVPWPVRELISDLLHHLERFRCPLHRFKYPTSGPATIPLLWNSLRTQVFTWARSRGRKGTKTSTRLRSITLLNCRPPASLKAPAAISGSSWNGYFFIFCNVHQKVFSEKVSRIAIVSSQQYLRKGNLFSGFAFPPGWKSCIGYFFATSVAQEDEDVLSVQDHSSNIFLPLFKTTCSPHHQLLHSDRGKVSLHPAPQKASCQPEILLICWIVAKIISPRRIWKYCVDMQNHCLWSRNAAGLCSLRNLPRDEEEDHE